MKMLGVITGGLKEGNSRLSVNEQPLEDRVTRAGLEPEVIARINSIYSSQELDTSLNEFPAENFHNIANPDLEETGRLLDAACLDSKLSVNESIAVQYIRSQDVPLKKQGMKRLLERAGMIQDLSEYISQNPQATRRDAARAIGATEHQAGRMIRELGELTNNPNLRFSYTPEVNELLEKYRKMGEDGKVAAAYVNTTTLDNLNWRNIDRVKEKAERLQDLYYKAFLGITLSEAAETYGVTERTAKSYLDTVNELTGRNMKFLKISNGLWSSTKKNQTPGLENKIGLGSGSGTNGRRKLVIFPEGYKKEEDIISSYRSRIAAKAGAIAAGITGLIYHIFH